MENNDAFEGDAEIQALNRSSSSVAKDVDVTDAMTAVYSSIDGTTMGDASEEDPLLGRSRTRDADHHDSSSAPDITWTGDKDFEGVPWWRTPSVCYESEVRDLETDCW